MMSVRNTVAMVHPVLRTAGISRAVVGRGFAFTTTARSGLKESASETNDFDKHKKDSLDKQKRGTGHWKPELASDSEEAVKADRSPSESVQKLQERTKRTAEERVRSGTSQRDGL